MKLKKIILMFVYINLFYSCANYSVNKNVQNNVRQYYSSSGFALIYEDSLFVQKVVNKKINNEDIKVMHSLLKINKPIFNQ